MKNLFFHKINANNNKLARYLKNPIKIRRILTILKINPIIFGNPSKITKIGLSLLENFGKSEKQYFFSVSKHLENPNILEFFFY